MTNGEGLASAFERVCAEVPVSPPLLSDDRLVAAAQAVEELARQVEGMQLAIAREFDRRTDETLGDDSLAHRLGAKKPWGALETVTRITAKDARERVAEARRLAKLPALEDAVITGRLGRAEAAEIAAPLLPAADRAAPELTETACAQLLELARALPATAVAEAARAWASVLDPDGVVPVEQAAFEKRFLTLGRAHEGLVRLTGLLTIEQAATVRALLDAHTNPRAGVAFTPAGDDEDLALAGGPDQPPADSRTAGQKRVDALHAIFAAQARAADAPTMGGAHPTLLITVTREVYETGAGSAWIDGEDEPVTAQTARRIADTGGYQEAETTAEGAVLTLGRTQRCFTPQQRKALAIRDKGCVIPGCTIPARWCEVHHITPWQHGGQTNLDNAALLCWYHHATIDTGPYQLRVDSGTPEARWTFGSHTSPWVKAVHRPGP